MSEHPANESNPALAKAREETRLLLALLGEERPDPDELKDRWYVQGFAVREAVKELRRAEESRGEGGRR